MLLTPETIIQNRYHIRHLIAQGGMGAVYQATDQRLGSTVALKQVLTGDQAESKEAADFCKAFEREARLLANLSHPALPSVSDYFTEGQSQFLVMQFIPGDDLGTVLEHDSKAFFSADGAAQILQWTNQLLDVLDYLHRRQPPVIHRDIKPRNLKPTPHGDIILLDFGIAKGATGKSMFASVSVHSVRAFTMEYAPLEQVQGSGTDPRSDLYALSATLHHLLTGTAPPDALTRAAAMLSGEADPLRPVHEVNHYVPPSVSFILQQAMEPRLPHRFARAKAMRTALHAALQSASAHAFSPASGLPDTEERDSSGQSTIVTPSADTPLVLPVPPPPAEEEAPASAPPLLTLLQQVLVVSTDDAGCYCTISDALADAVPGARIVVRPGHYTEQLVLDKPVEIIGDGAADAIIIESTDITPYRPTPCIVMQSDYALIRGVTLRGTQGQDGEQPASTVEVAQGRLILEQCDISEREGPQPFNPTACVRVHGAETSILLWQCHIHHAGGAGISISDEAQGILETCDIAHNAGDGIAVRKGSNPLVRQCTIHHGEHQGISLGGKSSAIVERCDIFANGQAGVEIKQGATPFVTGCTIHDHAANCGIYVYEKGGGIVERCDIFANGHAGIGIAQGGVPLVRNCTIHDGKQWGIFIWNRGGGTIESCNIATNGKAGVSIAQESKPTIRHCRIHGGKKFGVLVWEQGSGSIESCAIFANAHAGVSIMQGGRPVIRRCAINRNGVVAVLVREGSTGRIEACDLTSNARGAWYIEDGAQVRQVGNKE